MSHDGIHERGKTLEDRFFHDVDQKLLNQLRAASAGTDDKASLSAISGIEDTTLLNTLVQLGINSETFSALSLVPVVAVAWADDRLETAERDAILKAASEAGIEAGSASLELVRNWLQNKPGEDLIAAWKSYIASLAESLPPAALEQIKAHVMGRARLIAQSAGSILGFTSGISKIEQKKLQELEAAFQGE